MDGALARRSSAKEVNKSLLFCLVNEMNLERKRPDGTQVLPSGWKREEVVRRKGLSAGKIDVFYCRCGYDWHHTGTGKMRNVENRERVKCGMFLPGSYQVRPHLIPMTEPMWPSAKQTVSP